MGEAGGRLQNPTLAIIVFTPEGFDSHLFPQFDQSNRKQQPCGYAVTQRKNGCYGVWRHV